MKRMGFFNLKSKFLFIFFFLFGARVMSCHPERGRKKKEESEEINE